MSTPQIDSPCKDCKSRLLGCHSNCEKYRNYKEQLINTSREKAKQQMGYNYQTSVVLDRMFKNAKRTYKR